MQITTIDRINLSHELQQRLADYEVGRDTYIKLQNQYTEVAQEDVRLKQKATELEGQARRTDTSWNAMAKSGTIDQGKINEEIERSAQLRKDAQALHLTAEARIGIQKKPGCSISRSTLEVNRHSRFNQQRTPRDSFNEGIKTGRHSRSLVGTVRSFPRCTPNKCRCT